MQTKRVFRSILISLVLTAALTYAVRAWSTEGFGSYGSVTAIRRDTVVAVTVAGRNGWSINTAYFAKVRLGAEVQAANEGLYKGISKDGSKASEVTWYVESPAGTGKVQIVFCDARSCTTPVEGEFKVLQ